MNSKARYILIFVASTAIIVGICLFAPGWLSDSNSFLKGFMTHEILNVFGVILAITLASSAQIHLEFNRLEERYGGRFLESARSEIKQDSIILIVAFILSVILLIIKSNMNPSEQIAALFNGLLLLLLLANVLTLLDILKTVFVIKSDINKAITK